MRGTLHSIIIQPLKSKKEYMETIKRDGVLRTTPYKETLNYKVMP